MEKFVAFESKAIPLPIKNVDTDMIIPAQFLTNTTREGWGENLFRRLRDTDPEFVLNKERFKGGEILVADENFGCGSSREHAVWAIVGGGIRVVISKSFADIFYNNSGKNGLLLIRLPAETVDHLLAEAESGELRINVDLEKQTVTLPDGQTHSFEYDPFRKHCLLNGLDDIDYIVSHKDAIDGYRESREDKRFFSTLLP